MSDEGLLNSAASSKPRSMAGTISPPARIVTAAPISLNRSAERPTVRYFMPLKSSPLLISFLNQPIGQVDMYFQVTVCARETCGMAIAAAQVAPAVRTNLRRVVDLELADLLVDMGVALPGGWNWLVRPCSAAL